MIESGENISFTLIRKKGSSYHISSKDGVMVQYGDALCIVKGKNGRTHNVETKGIRLAGQKNALTEFLLRDSGNKEQA